MTQVLSFDRRFFLRCANCRLYIGEVKGEHFAQNLGLFVRADLLAMHSDGRHFAFVDEDTRTLFICRMTSDCLFTEIGRVGNFDSRSFSSLEWDEVRGAVLAIHSSEQPGRARYQTAWFPEPALVA